MTPLEWLQAHRVRHDEGMPVLCSDCGGEIASFEVDGTRHRLGTGCLKDYLEVPAPVMTLGEVVAWLKAERDPGVITESELRLLDGDR
jgi:hypothetical protein